MGTFSQPKVYSPFVLASVVSGKLVQPREDTGKKEVKESDFVSPCQGPEQLPGAYQEESPPGGHTCPSVTPTLTLEELFSEVRVSQ